MFGPRPPRLIMLWLYPAVGLFILAGVVGSPAMLTAVLVLDGLVFVGVGIAVLRNIAGIADALMDYAREVSRRRGGPSRWFPQLWGVVLTLIGVAWLASGVARLL
jgi:hypothetical protein